MLCVNAYPREYVDECRTRVAAHVAAYGELVSAARAGSSNGSRLDESVDAFEPVFFNNLVVALDGYFTHRSRTLEQKDGNALNEVRVLCSSMMLHEDVMTADKGIKLVPERSVLGIGYGDTIAIGRDDFVRLSDAFFAELERKFV